MQKVLDEGWAVVGYDAVLLVLNLIIFFYTSMCITTFLNIILMYLEFNSSRQ
jgi:hypothetical protein